ncbi:hypothetical protein OHQ88_14410 [Micromonospora zamorensis]|uniref:hypothetical protein n=1 Tax=Micromonospora zamorensis TaxID=709883 RepID=UPI002E207D3C
MGLDKDILDQILQYALRWLIGWLAEAIVRTVWRRARSAVIRRATSPARRAIRSAARPQSGDRRNRGTRSPVAPRRPGGPARQPGGGKSRARRRAGRKRRS